MDEIPELLPPEPASTTECFPFNLMKTCGCVCVFIIVLVVYLVYRYNLWSKTAEGFWTAMSASIKETAEPIIGQDYDKCHPDCCCNTQWPVPADVAGTPTTAGADLAEYDKTPLQCRGCDGAGCICAKKGTNSSVPRCAN